MIKKSTKFLLAFLFLLSYNAFSQCGGTISDGGQIAASITSGIAPFTVNISDFTSASGDCPTCDIEYMFVIGSNSGTTYYYPSSLNDGSMSYTFTVPDPNITIRRCARYVGCLGWALIGESNTIYVNVQCGVNPNNGVFVGTPATCSGYIANNNGSITFQSIQNADKYAIITSGTFPSYSSATPLPSLPAVIQSGISNTGGGYFIRTYASDTCYTDYTVNIPSNQCPFPPPINLNFDIHAASCYLGGIPLNDGYIKLVSGDNCVAFSVGNPNLSYYDGSSIYAFQATPITGLPKVFKSNIPNSVTNYWVRLFSNDTTYIDTNIVVGPTNCSNSYTIKTDPTCKLGIAQNNGAIYLGPGLNDYKYVFGIYTYDIKFGISSLNATSYNGPSFYSATATTFNYPQKVKDGISNTGGSYILRIFLQDVNTSDTTFMDTTIHFPPVNCNCISNSTSISGYVFNDGNNSGSIDSAEVGYPYVIVNAYAPGSSTPITASTNSSGYYTLNGLTAGVKYRIEYVSPSSYMDAAVGAGSQSSVQFSEPGNCLNFGLRMPGICLPESNPRFVTGAAKFPNSSSFNNHVMSFRVSDKIPLAIGTMQGDQTVHPHQDDIDIAVGVPFAFALQDFSKKVFFTTVNTKLSMSSIFTPAPDSSSAIYVADYSGTNYSYLGHKLLVKLSDIGIDVSNQYPIGTETGNDIFGTSGLNGIDISKDGKTLYIVNAGNGKIVKLDISGVNYASLPSTAPTSANVSEIDIPTNITNAVNGRFRPTALNISGNTLYIGGVNDGSNGNDSDVRGKIISMDLTTMVFDSVFEFKPHLFTAGAITRKHGENKKWSTTYSLNTYPYTLIQPYINDFDFDDQGALNILVGNRTVFNPAPGTAFDAGYFIKAAKNSATSYELENYGTCGEYTNLTGFPDIDGPGGRWFYEQGVMPGSLYQLSTTANYHDFLAAGGVYNLSGSGRLVVGVADPFRLNQFGARFYDPTTGHFDAGISLGGTKAAALTGTEAVCDANPIEIGNYVWKDINSNGIQDGDEPGIPGVTVVLCLSGSNTPIATATTNGNGNYIFSTASGTSTGSAIYGLSLTNGILYDIKVTALGSDPLATGLTLTSPSTSIGESSGQTNTGSTLANSDAFVVGGIPIIKIRLGAPGENNHSYDFGFPPNNTCTPPNAGSNLIACGGTCVNLTGTAPTTGTWSAQTGNPSGATLGTTAAGVANVCFDSTASGTFYFIYNIGSSCEDTMSIEVTPKPDAGPDQNTCYMNGNGIATLAANGTGTWTEQSGNPGTSTITNATLATTTVTNFSAIGTYNYIWTNGGCIDTVSVVVNPNGTIGNYVWSDLNNNGTNDEPTTAGINGVIVELWDATTNTLVSSTTTANDGSSNPGYYSFTVCTSGDYKVKFPSTNSGNNLTTQTTTAATDNNSDANTSDGFSPTFTITTTGTGTDKDNLTIDAGYGVPVGCGSVGNYVWTDINHDGINNEVAVNGINGIIVELWDATTNTLVSSTTTANDGSSNPGYYNFSVCTSGDYKVKFPLSNFGDILTTPTTTAGVDNNSDANQTDGFSPVFTIDINGTGVSKDNSTIDAGYQFNKAQLGNYVWNDINQNGLQDPTEVGVAGITISLLTSTNVLVATTVTDAYGKYLFNPISAGTYKVIFSLPSNYVFTSSNAGTDSLDSDASPSTGMTGNYVIVVNDSNMSVDAGIYQPLPTTASVGNRVWFDGNSNGIQDLTEQGVSGVTISLFDCANPSVPVSTTISDANGNYLFENVVPGSYKVQFSSPIGTQFTTSSGTVSQVDNSDADSTGTTACFTVAAGDQLTYIDAGLKPQTTGTASIGDKVWNDTDQDGIQDGSETGVQGITVKLFASDGVTLLKTTTTNALGIYNFRNLLPGCYIVEFSNLSSGYVFTTSNMGSDSSLNSDADISTGRTSTVCVTASQNNSTIDAGIYNASNTNSIGNKVWYDANKNGIQDVTEYGYPGVVVTLCDNVGNSLSTTVTDANGEYLFDGLSNGTYAISFGFVSGYQFTAANADANGISGSSNSDANPSSGKTNQVTLIGNTHITTVDAGIYPGNSRTVTSSLGDIVWFDLDANGSQGNSETGVPGITVTLYENDGTTIIDSTVTDGLGNYIFTNLSSGQYIIGFSNLPVGYTFTSATGLLEDELNSDADVSTGKTSLINLGAGEDKMSVDAGLLPPANSASLGNYVWIDLNTNGLQDANEPSVAGVTVKLYDDNDNEIGVASTNSDGYYMFSDLAPGDYRVGFENLPAGYTLTTSSGVTNDPTNSDANQSTGLTGLITLLANDINVNVDAGIVSTTTAIVGNYVWYDEDANGIQDANEAPIPGVLVTLYDNTNTAVASAVTDADGKYLFTNVLPGTYTIGFDGYPSALSATNKGANPSADDDSNIDPSTNKTDPFTVTAGSSNLTLDAGYKATPIAGLGNYVWNDVNQNGLQDASEPGIPGVIVTLLDPNGTTVLGTAFTDGNGAYSFPNLPISSYIVQFGQPQGLIPTTQNIDGQGLNGAANSDMNITTFKTTTITLTAGNYNPNIDAGFHIATVVPVVLTDFTVVSTECKAQVYWTTSEEHNSNYFEL